MAELGQEQSEQLIRDLSQQINRWRLATPALVLLQTARPLSFVASQGLLLCEPLLGFFYETAKIEGYAELLADRASLDHLVTVIEEESHLRDNGGKEKG